jgi:hypothetical protein
MIRELLEMNRQQVLQFFYSELRDTESGRELSEPEALHVASVLAHFAHVSVSAPASDLPPPASLSQIFRQLTLLDELSVATLKDPEIMRMAAAQSLFAVGFLSREARLPSDLHWFVVQGRAYYVRASTFSSTETDQKTYYRMSKNFLPWVHACRDIQSELRYMPFALNRSSM